MLGADCLKQIRFLSGSARPAVDCGTQGAPGWPVPATETQDSSGPHGHADRCLTSRAMLAAGINGSRLRYFLDLGESFRR